MTIGSLFDMPFVDISDSVAGGIGDSERELLEKPSSWHAASASTKLAVNAKRFTIGNPAVVARFASGRLPTSLESVALSASYRNAGEPLGRVNESLIRPLWHSCHSAASSAGSATDL